LIWAGFLRDWLFGELLVEKICCLCREKEESWRLQNKKLDIVLGQRVGPAVADQDGGPQPMIARVIRGAHRARAADGGHAGAGARSEHGDVDGWIGHQDAGSALASEVPAFAARDLAASSVACT